MTEFTETCSKPYDRHFYLLKTKTGQTFAYEDYEQLRAAWFYQSQTGILDTVIVMDAQQDPKGFK